MHRVRKFDVFFLVEDKTISALDHGIPIDEYSGGGEVFTNNTPSHTLLILFDVYK